MKRTRLVLAVAFAAAGAAGTYAGSSTANLAVSASVTQNCKITGGTLNFGAYDPIDVNATTDLAANTTFTVACSKGSTGVWIGMGDGANASGTQRRLKDSGSNYLNYSLYKDNGPTPTSWGGTSASGLVFPPPASKAPVTQTVYGKVAAGQDAAVSASTYTDTVVMTVNF